MTPLYRALTRLDAAALREIAACKDEPLDGFGTIAGAKPCPGAVARIALPLLDCYEGRSGDPQALIRAVEQYARRSGSQVYLDADDAARLTVPAQDSRGGYFGLQIPDYHSHGDPLPAYDGKHRTTPAPKGKRLTRTQRKAGKGRVSQ